MNFIKKKIKGKKAITSDDDDLDPNLFHVPHPSDGGPEGWVPYDERIDQDSEEWLAFKQLTQRVTDTLQQTQRNLSKIVAESALDEQSKDIKPVVTHAADDDDDAVNGFGIAPATAKPFRPPPPRPAPPRPPPPPQAAAAAAEPPPDSLQLEFDLHAEFGFSASPLAPVAAGSLFLDDDSHLVAEDGDDPFDTSFVAAAAQPPTAAIPGVVSLEELEEFRHEPDGDDPFVVAMDPFEALLGTASVAPPPMRAKSPNPFLADPEPAPPLASSNPFAASAANDVDFFAGGAAPNPFAAAQPQSADMLDLFDVAPPPLALPPNPFGAFTRQPPAPTDLFDLDFESPSANAIPPPMLPVVPTSQSSQSADPFAAFMDDSGAEPDLFGFDASDPFGAALPPGDFASEPAARRVSFEAVAPALANDLDEAFGAAVKARKAGPPIPPKSANFPDAFAAKDVAAAAAPPRPPPPCRPARPPPPSITVKMDQPGLAWDEPAAALAPPPPAKPDLFDMFDAPPMTEATSAFDAFGSLEQRVPSVFDSGDVPTPSFDGDPFGDVPPLDEKIEFEPIPCTVVKMEAATPRVSGGAFDPFDAQDDAAGGDRRQSLDFAAGERKNSAESVAPLQAAERKQSADFAAPPLPMLDRKQSADFAAPPLQKLDRKQSADFAAPPLQMLDRKQSADFAAPPLQPTERKQSAGFMAPLQPAAAPLPMSAVDFFSDFDTAAETKCVVVSASIPRPPSVEVLDAFGDAIAAAPAPPPPPKTVHPSSAFDLMSEGDDFFSEPGMQEAAPPPAFGEATAFDAFEAKFQSAGGQSTGAFDPFADAGVGNAAPSFGDASAGFGAADEFDPFFAIKETPTAPKPSPARFTKKAAKAGGGDDDDSDSDFDDDDTGPDFSVFIRPKIRDKDDAAINVHLGPIPVLAPPPKSPLRSPTRTSPTPRFNPFDKEPGAAEEALEAEPATPPPLPDSGPEVPRDLPGIAAAPERPLEKTESQESPGSPLFEMDDSEPLEDFYPPFQDEGWELLLRQPSKKKLTGQRFWKKVWVTLSDNGVIHLYNKKEDKDAFQELPLQACYSLSEVGAQQYDAYGKIFTVKLQYVFYRERVGVRPGQISKVAHGQITSLGQLAKLGLPLEHAPQVSQLLKLASPTYSELKVFVRLLEDTLFHLTVHRDRALTYKTEEVQVTVIDELRADVACSGVVLQQLARVRVFFLAFITSMPDVEIGLNDITKQGKEVVGRHDIIPVITEEWIRLEKCEFHSCVLVEEFEKHRNIKLHPPDACFFELLRFRIRPPRNRELPLQVKTTMSVIGSRVEIRADVLVPGCISRKHGQIPCEDVSIRFPLPECWIYLFRVEKHFRYGSVKSASRKPGKIKGLERFMGAGLTLEPSLIEVSTGQAKYEHQHRAIVWRIPRLPKDGQGAYTTQLFVCRMELTSYDQIPEEFDRYIYVEFNMPATTASHTTVRSVSVTNPNPPEKYVKYLARHEYRVEMEHVTVASECEYMAATAVSASTTAASSAGGSGSPVPSQ